MTWEQMSKTSPGHRASEATQVVAGPPNSRVPIKSQSSDDAKARDAAHAELCAAIGGDRRAIEHLLASIRPLVVRYCRARVSRQERSFTSADDVAQEVWLAVLKALPRYRQQGRPFLAFAYGIAAHKVADRTSVCRRQPL